MAQIAAVGRPGGRRIRGFPKEYFAASAPVACLRDKFAGGNQELRVTTVWASRRRGGCSLGALGTSTHSHRSSRQAAFEWLWHASVSPGETEVQPDRFSKEPSTETSGTVRLPPGRRPSPHSICRTPPLAFESYLPPEPVPAAGFAGR